MEELRSLTPSGALHGKGKLARNSNVTVIQIMPSERANRRIDKEIRRRSEASASDFEVVTVTPVSKEEANSSLLKLHILNIRTGKIQDAIISSDFKPKTVSKKSGKEESHAIVNGIDNNSFYSGDNIATHRWKERRNPH